MSDQDEQPTPPQSGEHTAIWPPPPKGMEPLASESRFKAAPVYWAIGWLIAYAAFSAIVSGIELSVAANPRNPALLQINTFSSLFQGISGYGALIAFLVWFYRSYKNLYAFDTVGLRYTAGWAVGWFFVPALSLARPYQCAQVIWKASAPNVDNRSFASWNGASDGAIVGVWWFLTLVSQCAVLLPVAALYQQHGVLTSGDYVTSAIADCLVVAADIVTIFLIRAVSARQLVKAMAEPVVTEY